MQKLYIKQRRFYAPSSGKKKLAVFCDDAALSVDYLNRIAVFETLRVYGGRLFRADEHMTRLAESCGSIGNHLPLTPKELLSWMRAELAGSGYAHATLRLSVHWKDRTEGVFLLIIREFTSHPPEWYEKGVELRTTVSQRWTLKAQNPQVKATQYVSGVLAFLDKGGLEAHELVFLGAGGTVAEGTVSNLFFVSKKTLLTPSVSSGILKGVTRGVVLELARRRKWPVLETHLTRHDLYSADECFLTNTSSEILPVTRMDGRRIGAGTPGHLTQTLADDFKKCRFNA